MEVLKGIPIPKKVNKGQVLYDLEPGDSIVVDRDEAPAWRSAMWNVNRYSGQTYTSLKVDAGVQIWRKA